MLFYGSRPTLVLLLKQVVLAALKMANDAVTVLPPGAVKDRAQLVPVATWLAASAAFKVIPTILCASGSPTYQTTSVTSSTSRMSAKNGDVSSAFVVVLSWSLAGDALGGLSNRPSGTCSRQSTLSSSLWQMHRSTCMGSNAHGK